MVGAIYNVRTLHRTTTKIIMDPYLMARFGGNSKIRAIVIPTNSIKRS
jgi:hypothetical protein